MQVKVWNDNDHPHSEKYKGDKIEIAAKSFILMDEDEAHQLLGQFTPIVRRGDNTPDPRFFKMLRIDAPEKKATATPNPLMFHATGQIAKSIEELKQLQGQYSHLMVDDASNDKIDAVTRENADLKARLEKLESLIEAAAKPRGKKVKPEGSETSESEV